MKFAAFAVLAALSTPAWGQPTPAPPTTLAATHSTPTLAETATNQTVVTLPEAEGIRLACINGRRSICGKILKVLPDGLVVDSGYTDLMRPPLNESWLVPGTATASRPPNLVEGNEPDSVAVGLVFLTSLPKGHGAKPKPYDYVVIEGYPAGLHSYVSVGNIKRTVRLFSCTLPKAVQLIVQARERQNPVPIATGK